MSDGMGTTIEYAYTAVALSLISVILAAIYTVRVVKMYRTFHDERAAVALAKAVGLLVIAVGMLISASGLVADMAILSVAGLSVARGAFVVLLATLVLAHVRPGTED